MDVRDAKYILDFSKQKIFHLLDYIHDGVSKENKKVVKSIKKTVKEALNKIKDTKEK